ncbi:hypothetical protein [Micromonospora zamorensis]|uniref:hypothetical protein n=1 Tax=Micromonospora zamorensis TaxID=709883 RepID=UPI003CF6CA7D
MPAVIAGLEIPETAAVAEATRHVRETTTPLLRVQFDGLKNHPETTNGTVNSDILDHFIPRPAARHDGRAHPRFALAALTGLQLPPDELLWKGSEHASDHRARP